MNRRSLTPNPGTLEGLMAQRRATGGARREISSRVVLRIGSAEHDGWALNISRGGIRVVIEERVELGQEFEVEGWNPDEPEAPTRTARVVWVQDEPDGSVLGMEFLDKEAGASVPPPGPPGDYATPPPPPPDEPLGNPPKD